LVTATTSKKAREESMMAPKGQSGGDGKQPQLTMFPMQHKHGTCARHKEN
jgi:hypothetical protein